MIVIPVKLTTYKSNWENRRTLTRASCHIPEPTLKSGYRYLGMCGSDFNAFFNIPSDAKKARFHFTKREQADGTSYKMEHTTKRRKLISYYSSDRWYTDHIRTLDGFTMPGLMGSGHKSFDSMIERGYNHVSLSYE